MDFATISDLLVKGLCIVAIGLLLSKVNARRRRGRAKVSYWRDFPGLLWGEVKWRLGIRPKGGAVPKMPVMPPRTKTQDGPLTETTGPKVAPMPKPASLPRTYRHHDKLDLSELPDVSEFPYRQRFKFLTDRERAFYDLLRTSCAKEGYRACPKVRLADVFWVPGDSTNQDQEFWKWFSPIARRHVDFLVLDTNDAALFAIELDDTTHDTLERTQVDLFKDAVFSSAGLPLIRTRIVPDLPGMDSCVTLGTKRASDFAGKRPVEPIDFP